jgi:glycosyltransferase involved in cell wall biosynthesis
MLNFLSIVIPVFNTESYLPKLLTSLQAQSNKSFEVIFVNDGSTDNSRYILENFNYSFKHRIINNNNQGVSISRNVGIQASIGTIISFIDSDDYISENYVDRILSVFDSDANFDLFIFNYKKINLTKGLIRIKPKVSKNSNSLPDLFFMNRIVISTVNFAVMKELIIRNGIVFSEYKKNLEDVNFIYKIMNCFDFKFFDLIFFECKNFSVVP